MQIAQFATTPYRFGSGINLAAGERIVVARNPAVFQSVYGTGINRARQSATPTANLSNGGERIALLGPLGETLQDFTYDDIAPWPTSPDGGGPSLEIIDPLGDPANPATGGPARRAAARRGTDGAPTVLAGDYDHNGTVEDADHAVWKAAFGTTVTPGSGADGNGDGMVNLADYVVWRNNLGATQASGWGRNYREWNCGFGVPISCNRARGFRRTSRRRVRFLLPLAEDSSSIRNSRATSRSLRARRLRGAIRPSRPVGLADRRFTTETLSDAYRARTHTGGLCCAR